MESTIQWSQVAADNGVRPQRIMESDPTGRLTESLKDSSKDSSNQPPEGGADDFGNFDDEKPDDVTAAIEEFRATYPKSAATHVLDKPFRDQLKQGATAGELIRAAQKYAEECKFHNKALVHISAPARFLKEETWRSYAQLQDSGGDDSESIVERFKRIRAEEESLEEDCPF